jgi:hypothetical protein
MNNTKHAKRIQSRLSSQNIKISLGDIRNKALEMNLDLNDESSVENVFMAYIPSEIVDSSGNDGSNDELSLNPVCDEVETVQTLDTPTNTQPDLVESTDLVFSNDFEKAALAQSELKSSGIELSTIQSIELVANTENRFDSKEQFILSILDVWEKLQLQQSSNFQDIVSSRISEIKTNEILTQNQIKQSLMDADNYINDSRNKFCNDLEKFVNDIVARK